MKNAESAINNLFLIGAGFTKAVFPNAPLNKDLFPIICKNAPSITTTLKKHYKELNKTNDIEILLTRLDLGIHIPKAKRQTDLKTVRKTIEQQLAEYFQQFRFGNNKDKLKETEWLELLAKEVFADNDILINLNYDCSLEGLLDYHKVWSPNGGYAGIRNPPWDVPSNPKNIRIFKLHGSEHFIEAGGYPNKEKTEISFPVDESIYPRSGKNRFFQYGLNDLGRRPYIIAPSFVKVPHQDIELMMIKALKVAASVKNVIVIGCSLRQEDSFLWLLLTSFLNQPINKRKLVIIDPYAEKIKSKICAHYFVDISNFINITLFSDSLQSVIKQLINELHDNNP